MVNSVSTPGREVHGERHEIDRGEGPGREDRQRDHRVRGPGLGDDEPDQRQPSKHEGEHHHSDAGPTTGPGGQPVRDAGQPGRPQQRAGDVETVRRLGVGRLGYVPSRDHEHGDRDRDVDQEDQAPAGHLDDPAAEERPDRPRDAGQAGPGADRPHPVPVDERGLQDGQGTRGQQSATDALQCPGSDQEADAGGNSAEQRRDREPGHADQVDPASAEAVTQRAAEQDERGQGQGVTVDHPLQTGRAGAQVVPDPWQRDVDHGAVDERHTGPEDGRQQDPPAGGLAVPDVTRRQRASRCARH